MEILKSEAAVKNLIILASKQMYESNHSMQYLIKILSGIRISTRINNPEISMEPQKTKNSQKTILRKNKAGWMYHTP